MSTRCNVALRLRDEDIKKTHRAACGLPVNPRGNHYLQIYIHSDGYPNGVGADLVHLEYTYDDFLDFILEGDRSDVYKSYCEWRGEKCPPTPLDEPVQNEEYLYVVEEVEYDAPCSVRCFRNGKEIVI